MYIYIYIIYILYTIYNINIYIYILQLFHCLFKQNYIGITKVTILNSYIVDPLIKTHVFLQVELIYIFIIFYFNTLAYI